MESKSNTISEKKKSCVNCGAELTYKPGTTSIACDYCGHQEEIPQHTVQFEELALEAHLKKMGTVSHTETLTLLDCKNCGASQHIEEHYKSLHCVYCATPLIVEDTYTEDWIVPGAVLPFQFDQKKSHQLFADWIASLWFAPNKLKKASLDPHNTKGLYLPYWTFDAQLFATYSGERGEYYYVNVSTTVNGKKTKRRERRTRWYHTNGKIQGFVDDTLINASLQHKHIIPKKITDWKLSDLVPFNSSFLAGFVTEKYTIPLQDGHVSATEKAKQIARSWTKHDIGGDTQRIHNIDMSLTEETFKHILLPIYISAYSYKDKQYHFYINGQTGSITGKRPYSFWKIAGLIIGILILIWLIYYLI